MYKYLDQERIDVIENCMIRYSPMFDFNDPFEGCPEINSLTSLDEAKEIIKAALETEAPRMYAAEIDELKAHVPFETYFQKMLNNLEQNPHSAYESLETQRTNILEQIAREKGAVAAFCLSEVPDSLLMWAHYSNSHAGFVLEFNTHHSHFHEQKSETDDFRHLRRVQYREARPSGMLTKMGFAEFFLVKSGHWSYEREWRIFRNIVDSDKTISNSNIKIHLFKFPPDALTAIIVGARTPVDVIKKIKHIISSKHELNHVQLRYASTDNSHFLLRITDSIA